MSSSCLSLSLLFWYIQYLNVILVYCIRCGHDDVEYDIIRNDHIEPEPLSSSHSKSKTKSLFNPLASLSSAIGAEEWLLDKIDNHHHTSSKSNAQENIANNNDIIQTFSSRKNTKPHRHHTSKYAFEHNIHTRHHPDPIIDHANHDLLFIDEDENDNLDKNIWKPFRIHYNSDSLLKSWDNQDEANHFAENVIPAAIHYLERSLYVRPIKDKLKLSRPCVKFIVDEETGKKKCIQLKWNWEQCGSHVTIPTDDFEV